MKNAHVNIPPPPALESLATFHMFRVVSNLPFQIPATPAAKRSPEGGHAIVLLSLPTCLSHALLSYFVHGGLSLLFTRNL